MNERLNRAIRQLKAEGLLVEDHEPNKVAVFLRDDVPLKSAPSVHAALLTHAQLLELMDKDQLTWQGIKELQRESDGE